MSTPNYGAGQWTQYKVETPAQRSAVSRCPWPPVTSMQCKDIPDLPVLKFLDQLGEQPATWIGGCKGGAPSDHSVLNAMPAGTPPKLARAKMDMLIRRGLADGCACGCYGGFSLTKEGREYLAQQQNEESKS